MKTKEQSVWRGLDRVKTKEQSVWTGLDPVKTKGASLCHVLNREAPSWAPLVLPLPLLPLLPLLLPWRDHFYGHRDAADHGGRARKWVYDSIDEHHDGQHEQARHQVRGDWCVACGAPTLCIEFATAALAQLSLHATQHIWRAGNGFVERAAHEALHAGQFRCVELRV